MKNTSKKFPLPIGDRWFRLPERVSALEDSKKSTKILKGTIIQEANFAPVVAVKENSLGDDLEFTYDSPGIYKIFSPKGIFPSRAKVAVTLGLAKQAIIAAVNYSDVNTIVLTVFDVNGTPGDNLLLDNLITIEILD